MCPSCKHTVVPEWNTESGRYICPICKAEISVKARIKMLKETPAATSHDENRRYQCQCGSRQVTETFLLDQGLYIINWNLDLSSPPQGWDVMFNDMRLFDLSCGKCNIALTSDEQFLFDKEIAEKYGV